MERHMEKDILKGWIIIQFIKANGRKEKWHKVQLKINNLNSKVFFKIDCHMEKVKFISKNPNTVTKECLKMVFITIKMDYNNVSNIFIQDSSKMA